MTMRSIRDSRLALEDKTTCLLTWNNLYPKLVLNRCGAISTDTMCRMKFRDGIDPELAIIAYNNSIAFAFTELYGRSYGDGVLEILPKKVGNIHVLNTGLLNINPELKRNVISIIDGVVRNGRNIDEALDYIDAKILVGVLRFDKDTCRACRRIWKDIESKAPWQRHKIGSDYNDQHKIYLD